jgi:hypothetical protein
MPKFTPWWLAPILAAGLSLMSTLYLNEHKMTLDENQRISTLEAHQADMTSRLDRIENKLDKIVDAVVAK